MKISILITSKIQFHTAQFYIYELIKNGVKIELYTYKFIYYEFKDGDWKNIKPHFIDSLGVKNYLVKRLHFIFLVLYTPFDFSPMLERWIFQRVNKNIIVYNLIRILNRFFRKKEKNSINQFLRKKISGINTKLFNTKTVLNFTTNNQPHLLCCKDLNVITVVESWDHPYKFPIGYVSNKVFVWNNALKRDWKIYQGDKDIEFGYQAKFDYIIKQKNKCDVSSKTLNCMYPFSTSSRSDKFLYADEIKLVNHLAQFFLKKDLELSIKPKPSTPKGELDYFNKYPNVKVLSYQNSLDGANYTLSKNYNEKRIEDLDSVDCVISRGTTFVLDAALYRKPVILLNFKTEQFPALSNLNNFPHLSRHFFSAEDKIILLNDNNSIDKQIEDLFK